MPLGEADGPVEVKELGIEERSRFGEYLGETDGTSEGETVGVIVVNILADSLGSFKGDGVGTGLGAKVEPDLGVLLGIADETSV